MLRIMAFLHNLVASSIIADILIADVALPLFFTKEFL